MAQLSYPEVFEKIGQTKSINEKKAILKENENRKYFRELLIYMFDPRINFVYTKSTVPIWVPDDSPEGMNINRIWNVLPRVGYFADYSPMCGPDSKPTEKMNHLLISVLESITSKDARLIELIITNSKYPYNGLTEKLVRDTFPKLLGKVEKKTTNKTKKEKAESKDEKATEESTL